jgi:hypothetical protein
LAKRIDLHAANQAGPDRKRFCPGLVLRYDPGWPHFLVPMTPLTKQYVEQCPVEEGFRMRGVEMTRIEVFVDAAFAFAVTMLVISFDHIPGSYEEVIMAIKGIPAFVVAVVQLIWIWYVHSRWSKRYGLENAVSVVLSAALLIAVLIYIYPLRIMVAGMFRWFSGGFLPSGFSINSYDELAGMFVFMGIGFAALSLIFVLMYRYAGALKGPLRLSDYEVHETRTLELLWTGIGSTGIIAIILALTLADDFVPFSGFAFALIGLWVPWVRSSRHRHMVALGIRSHSPEPQAESAG